MDKLNIGCGYKKIDGFINIDFDERHEPDILLDLEWGKLPLADESVDVIFCSHVLEHVLEWERLMGEFHRVLVPDGSLEIWVPIFPSTSALAGLGHKRFFTPASFTLFVDPLAGQPRAHAGDYYGMFYEEGDPEVRLQVPSVKTAPGDERAVFGAPVDAEMRVFLRKATQEHWVKNGACDNIQTDLSVCLFCQKLLQEDGFCCGQKYTFAEGYGIKKPTIEFVG